VLVRRILLITGLHKGVPPLFVNLRSLYTDKEKIETISFLLVQYKEALKAHGHFNDLERDDPREPASALLWTYYYLAQHYDYLGETEKALTEIDAAIDHTPTLIELFVTKGRIYKVRSRSRNRLFLYITRSMHKHLPRGTTCRKRVV
jgi:peptide alpha-N-acetyltransferase